MKIITLIFMNKRPLHITNFMLAEIFGIDSDIFYVEDKAYRKSEILTIKDSVYFDKIGPMGIPGNAKDYSIYKGYWEPSKSYVIGDIIEYNWKQYKCKKCNVCKIPYNKEFWEVIK